jgi:glycosyltransferase involved in cell wall biosynthesis
VRASDFGPCPPQWAEKINREFDQLWAYSSWMARMAAAGGVDASRIRVVPLGVDTDVFRPDGPRFDLPTRKRFRFLFVGGAVVRKGVDTMLRAYASAFGPGDDVCLVIKGHTDNVFYARGDMNAEIERLAAGDGPEVHLIDRHLPEEELAALYRSCDAAVFPYRAEGFGLPILESMASGTPAIVPRFGACLDFCTDETSVFLPVVHVRLPVGRSFQLSLGFRHHYEQVDFCDERPTALMDALRRVSTLEPEALAAMGRAGARRAAAHFTWQQSGERVAACLGELANQEPVRLAGPRRVAARRAAHLAVARDMLAASRRSC